MELISKTGPWSLDCSFLKLLIYKYGTAAMPPSSLGKFVDLITFAAQSLSCSLDQLLKCTLIAWFHFDPLRKCIYRWLIQGCVTPTDAIAIDCWCLRLHCKKLSSIRLCCTSAADHWLHVHLPFDPIIYRSMFSNYVAAVTVEHRQYTAKPVTTLWHIWLPLELISLYCTCKSETALRQAPIISMAISPVCRHLTFL